MITNWSLGNKNFHKRSIGDHGFKKYTQKYGSEVTKLFKEEIKSPILDEYYRLYELEEKEYKSAVASSYLVSFLRTDLFGYENFLLHTDELRNFPMPRIDNSFNANMGLWAKSLFKPERFRDEIKELALDSDFNKKMKEAYTSFIHLSKNQLGEYISESLIISSKAPAKLSLVSTISLIEAILIRKPDANRYHIEDSIMKQFILKLGLLLEGRNQTLDLSATRLKLRELYTQRSNIAHGNFEEFEKVARKSKLDFEFIDSNPSQMDIEEYTYELAHYAEDVLRIVLQEYIDNFHKVQFMKGN